MSGSGGCLLEQMLVPLRLEAQREAHPRIGVEGLVPEAQHLTAAELDPPPVEPCRNPVDPASFPEEEIGAEDVSFPSIFQPLEVCE